MRMKLSKNQQRNLDIAQKEWNKNQIADAIKFSNILNNLGSKEKRDNAKNKIS